MPKAKVSKNTNDLEIIRAGLGHLTFEWKPTEYLDTGFADLNEVLGHKIKGLTFGRIMEISGWSSQGKTAISLSLAALAQQQEAGIIWADFENSFDIDWARSRGMEIETTSEGQVVGPDSFTLVQPYVGTFDGKETRLTNAQELCSEIQAVIEAKSKRFNKIMLVVDSIPAMLPEYEAEAGLEGANMRSDMDLPKFLSRLMRRWIGLAQSYNVLMVLINQLRSSPVPFKPDYTPGGNAVPFYSHVRVRIRRAKGGMIKRGGKTVGMQGIIENNKNKSGSPEKSCVGFKLYWEGPIEFVEAKKLDKDEL